MVWPFSAINAAREEIRLLQECIDELLSTAESKGFGLDKHYLAYKVRPVFYTFFPCSKELPHEALIELMDLKRNGTNYYMDFWIPVTRTSWTGCSRCDEYLPEGYIDKPIGLGNNLYESKRRKVHAVTSELMNRYRKGIYSLEECQARFQRTNLMLPVSPRIYVKITPISDVGSC